MKAKLIIWMLLMLNFVVINAQTINGLVVDKKTGNPLVGAHVIEEGMRRVFISKPDGSFELAVSTIPTTINISHVGYKTKSVELKRYEEIIVSMEEDEKKLSEVVISSLPQRNILKSSKIYVFDYGFEGDKILLLGYTQKSKSKPALMIINSLGDTLETRNIPSGNRIYTDCFDINHLITQSTASQIHYDGKAIQLLYETHKDTFLNSFNSIVGYYDGKFLIRQNTNSNQMVRFFTFNFADSSLNMLTEIVDEEGLERLSDKGRLQSYQDYTKSDARFEEMCFYREKELATFLQNDSIIIFNTVDGKIEIFNFQGTKIHEATFLAHQSRFWDRNFFMANGNSFYTNFTEQGITKVCKINIANGEIDKTIYIPKMNHTEKIKINGNKLYFLYKNSEVEEVKQLFCMNL